MGDSPGQYRRLEAEAIKAEGLHGGPAQDNTGGLRRTRLTEEASRGGDGGGREERGGEERRSRRIKSENHSQRFGN